MRILITGSSGFLGFHLARALLEAGHEVIGTDNYSGSDRENTLELCTLKKNFKFEFADCTNLDHMKKVFKDAKPDVVYHLACYPHEGLSVCSPYTITESVTCGTMAPLSCAAVSGVKRFIFASSMARYGNIPTVPFTEDMRPNPMDPYGWAKLAAEGQVRAICESYGMEWVIAIPHNIYGTHQRYHDPFRNVAAIMINRVIQGKQPIIYGDGTQKRCFSFVADLVPAFVKLATQSNVASETINLGPDEPFVHIWELAELICSMGKMQCDPIFVPGRPREVKHANCSADKARQLLEVEFETSLDDGLSVLFDWIKTKGPREFDYHLPIEIVHANTPKTWTQRTMSL